MSEHWVEFNRYIWKGFIYSELKLNPEDFWNVRTRVN